MVEGQGRGRTSAVAEYSAQEITPRSRNIPRKTFRGRKVPWKPFRGGPGHDAASTQDRGGVGSSPPPSWLVPFNLSDASIAAPALAVAYQYADVGLEPDAGVLYAMYWAVRVRFA